MWVVVTIVVLILGGAGFVMRSQIRSLLTRQQPAQESAVTSSPPGQTSPSANETPANNTGPETTVTAQVVEVDYTLAGFTPKSVTVKKGTTVRFINKTTESTDVASNPHPIHTDYPGFDQYKSASAGKAEYDFTLDKVGTWGYHNHLKPTDLGTVVVTE